MIKNGIKDEQKGNKKGTKGKQKGNEREGKVKIYEDIAKAEKNLR